MSGVSRLIAHLAVRAEQRSPDVGAGEGLWRSGSMCLEVLVLSSGYS